MKRRINVGDRYKRLVITKVLEPKLYPNGRHRRRVQVRCDCGTVKEMFFEVLCKENTVGCGCYNKELLDESKGNLKHGLCQHVIYKCWLSMKDRCYNPNVNKFENWGGRGIKVCDDWLNDFVSFYNWSILNGWKEGLEIDRHPNKNGNYEPSNCRWATLVEQANNKRNNVIVDFKGEKITLPEACRRMNFDRREYQELHRRIKSRGCSFEEAAFNPLRKQKDSKVKTWLKKSDYDNMSSYRGNV